MYKVKATVVGFIGNEEKYPCHMEHKVGDEIIFDGERYIGRLCPEVWPLIAPKVLALFQAGPQYIEAPYYYPCWYVSPSVHDSEKKKYDGLGFRNVLQTHKEPQYHMANLLPPHAFEWPPYKERTILRDVGVICPDSRTAVVFALQAFDLSDRGFSIPYFRRQMMILHKVVQKGGTLHEAKVLDEFSKEEKEEIYPPMTSEMFYPLDEELVLMGYMGRKGRNVVVTPKGEAKLEEFVRSLSDEERIALKL